MRIAIATCVNLPEADPDEPMLLAALRAAGHSAAAMAWDDPDALFDAVDACIIRSTWNYYRKAGEFAAWIDAVASKTRLFNPPPVVHWNMHKGYLRDLERGGAPIVPTEFVPRGETLDLARRMSERGWPTVVVKPCVSAGSFRTHRFSSQQAAEAQQTLDSLSAERDAMIQPFLPAVETSGERSLIWIDGEFTHAIHKHPRFAGQEERVELASFDESLQAAGRRVIDAVRSVGVFPTSDLLYGRVDLMPGPEGEWLLSELEVIEPSLFFLEFPPALDRFVHSISHRLR